MNGWAFAMAVLASVIASSALGYGTRAALRIVRVSVRLLPENQRDDLEEEWSAEVLAASRGPIEARDGNHHAAALTWSLGTIPTAIRRSKAGVRSSRWVMTSQTVDRFPEQFASLAVGAGAALTLFSMTVTAYGPIVGLMFALGLGLALESPAVLTVGFAIGLALGWALNPTLSPLDGFLVGISAGLAAPFVSAGGHSLVALLRCIIEQAGLLLGCSKRNGEADVAPRPIAASVGLGVGAASASTSRPPARLPKDAPDR